MVRALLALWFSFVLAPAQYFQGRPPATQRPVKTFNYTYYAVGYSEESGTPLWSAMEAQHPVEPVLGCQRVGKFAPEPQAEPQIFHTDYRNSEGYSRGHMTPNAVMAYVHGCEAARTTFITSNIVPQLQGHNAGIWEALESAIGGKNSGSGFRPGLVQRVPEVWIYTGPVFWGGADSVRKLGPKAIWVPTAIWKTVIWRSVSGSLKTCSWMIPHQEGLLKGNYMEYVVSIRDIAEKAGINVLGGVDDKLYSEIDAQEFKPTE